MNSRMPTAKECIVHLYYLVKKRYTIRDSLQVGNLNLSTPMHSEYSTGEHSIIGAISLPGQINKGEFENETETETRKLNPAQPPFRYRFTTG